MKNEQPPDAYPVIDLVVAQPQVQQLTPGHDAVLAPGELGDRRVPGTSATLTTTIGVKSTRIEHRADRAAGGVTASLPV
jgi:hypothetical protein